MSVLNGPCNQSCNQTLDRGNCYQTEWNIKITSEKLKMKVLITQQIQKEEKMDKLEED